MNKDDELIMYFVANKDLDMSKGKIASQVAHTLTNYLNWLWVEGATGDNYKEQQRQNYFKWFNDDQKKIVLKAKQSKLGKLENKYWSIRDLGLTEIEKDSLTCVCLGIETREKMQPIVKRFRLL